MTLALPLDSYLQQGPPLSNPDRDGRPRRGQGGQ
jgi:hypothetical protein